jgi:hypothetical protein
METLMYPGFRGVAVVDVHACANFEKSGHVEALHRQPDRLAAHQVLV